VFFSVGYMSQKLWSSLTTTALIISALGTATASYANQVRTIDEGSAPSVSAQETPAPDDFSEQVAASDGSSTTELQPDEVAKVGEYQSQEEAYSSREAIASIYSHELDGSLATTLYVSSIPVLTFLESDPESDLEQPVAESLETSGYVATNYSDDSDVKVGSTQLAEGRAHTQALHSSSERPLGVNESKHLSTEPVWRAAAIAAQLNNLYQNRIDPSEIIVRWDDEAEQYVISVDEEILLSFTEDIRLPDTTGDLASDALHATNRLRRLLGGAPPLEDIEGRPQHHQVALGPVQFEISGMASWYGPGFHGRRSASGEVFDQNALTAAHRTLPFGTQVRVTNVNTGMSVVVRINDRGPFSHNRVIDLSAGAARAIGMIGAGVAPVNLEVLGTVSSSN
jgi:rare lipoprotein A